MIITILWLVSLLWFFILLIIIAGKAAHLDPDSFYDQYWGFYGAIMRIGVSYLFKNPIKDKKFKSLVWQARVVLIILVILFFFTINGY